MPGLAFAPSPHRKGNANQSRESDSGKIAKNWRWRANADCNFPQMQNGMGDKPRRSSSPQHKAIRRSNNTDTDSGAEEHLNKPNIADEMLIKGTRVGDARDEVIPRRWSEEHEQSVSKQKQAIEGCHGNYHDRNGPIRCCHIALLSSL
jgi:hypothetical protein